MSSFTITPTLIEKIHQILDKGLSCGLGEPIPGKMCVEAAICYALGEPHSDKPSCVNEVLRVLKYKINDLAWSSNKIRAEGLRRLAISQLGTKDNFNEQFFIEEVICVLLRKIELGNPIWTNWKKDYLENKNRKDSRAANYAAAYATYTAAAYVTYAAAAYATYAAAVSATYAAAAYATYATAAYATYAADAAANAAANAVYAADAAADVAASAAAYDKWLTDFCEEVVQVLIKMETPGAKWL